MNRGAVSSTLTIAARGWTQIAAVTLLLVAGRSLDITSFGEFAVASALTLMLSQWVGVGCYERVLSVHGAHRAADTSFMINTVSALAMVAAGLAMGGVAHLVYRSSTIATMVLLLAPLALFAGWRSAAEAAMLGEGKLIRYALSTIAIETAGLGFGVVWLINGEGVYGLVAAKYVQFAIGGPAFLLLVGRLPRLAFDRAEATAIFALWRSLILDRVLGYFQNYSADLLLGALLSPAAAGLYRISLRIVSLVTTIITDPLRSLGWTVLAKGARGGGSVARDSESMIGLVYALLCGPLALLALVGGDLAVLALGPQWAAAGPVIALLALAAIVMVPAAVSEAAFGVVGAIRELPRQRIVFVATALVLMIAAARFGPAWTAASQLVASIVSLGVVLRAHRAHLGVRIGGYAGVAGWTIGMAILAVCAAEVAVWATGASAVAWRAALQLAVGAPVYVAGVLLHSGVRSGLGTFSRAVGAPVVAERLPVIDAGDARVQVVG